MIGRLKTSPEDLAILGGSPAFPEPLHVGRPNVGDPIRFLARINEMLDRRWFTNDGPFLREFEQRIAAFLGVRHCVAMCNGTCALELTIRSLGLQGEVIVPSFTFVATAHALQWCGVRPVFADVDPTTHTLDPTQVERAITPRTTGILGVHIWGRPCAIDELTAIARSHRLHLIFDSAHAFACSYRGKWLGGFGDAEILSFHATKFFHTLEGGAVVTDNDNLAHRLRLMRNFGFAGYDTVVSVGTNAKMPEACAAMGLANLEALDDFVAVNTRNHAHYRSALDGLPGVTVVPYDRREHCNYQYVVLQIDSEQAGLSRDDLLEILWAEGILARRYFHPGVHQMEPYRALDPQAAARLPNTERLSSQVLVLPTGTAIANNEIETIVTIVRLALHHNEVIKVALNSRHNSTTPR